MGVNGARHRAVPQRGHATLPPAPGGMPATGPVPAAKTNGRGAGPAARTNIWIAIDRMTIEGCTRADHARVTAAMARTLARLFDAAPEVDWSAVRAVARLEGGAVPARATPEQIGRHLAARLFRRLIADA